MNQLNSVLIEGNIVRNAELSTVEVNKKICSLSIAVNRNAVKRDGTLYQITNYLDYEISF